MDCVRVLVCRPQRKRRGRPHPNPCLPASKAAPLPATGPSGRYSACAQTGGSRPAKPHPYLPSVHPAATAHAPRPGAYKQRTSVSRCPAAGGLSSGSQHGRLPARPRSCSPGLQASPGVLTWHGESAALASFLTQAPIPFVGPPSSRPNHLLKSPRWDLGFNI